MVTALLASEERWHVIPTTEDKEDEPVKRQEGVRQILNFASGFCPCVTDYVM